MTSNNTINSSDDFLQLLESNSKGIFRNILKNSCEAMHINKKGLHVFANDQFLEMYGYQSNEELAGKDIINTIHSPHHHETLRKNIIKRYAGEKAPLLFESIGIRADTSELPIEISISDFEYNNNTYTLSIHRDISERKHVEKTLKESVERAKRNEQRLSFAMSATQDAIWEWNYQTKETYYSSRWFEMLGYEDNTLEMNIDTWKGLCHPDDLKNTFDKIDAAILIPEGKRYITEFRMKHKNGSWIWILSKGTVVKRDQLGTPLLLSGTNTDISGLIKTETKLRKLSQAVEQNPTSILITDKDANIEYVNPAFCKLTGYSEKEVIGKNASILKADITPNEEYKGLWETITKGKIWQGELCNKKKNGELFWETARIAPLFDSNGNIKNFLAIKVDITERMQAEATKIKLEEQLRHSQKMESVGRLAGGVAHDFNNILSVILLNAEMALLNMDPSNQAYKELEEIKKAAKRSADITRQLFTFASKQSISPKIIDLNIASTDVLKMIERLIGENIQIIYQGMADLWPINADPSQIDQILVNLCVNAKDAISGIGTIHIETKNINFDANYCTQNPGSVPGDYVQIIVRDSGCGIDKETLPKIFEPFFTTKAKGIGTGMGLSTVYGIAKQHNGFIEVQSEPGKGTSFFVSIPKYKEMELSSKHNEPQKAPKGQETILLLEDELDILNATTLLLKKQGYTVLEASTAGEAIRLAQDNSQSINMVLTDVVMPEINGCDLMNHLLSIHPHFKCLFMSGYASDIMDNHGVLDKGMHFIQKPFSLTDLAFKVREVLEA